MRDQEQKRIKHTNANQVPLLFSSTKLQVIAGKPMPSLFDVPSQQRTDLFILKLNYAEKIFPLSPNALVPKISEILADDKDKGKQKTRGSGKFTKIMPKMVTTHSKIEAFDECEEKERILEDLLKYLANNTGGSNKYLFTEECYTAIVNMLKKNTFRCPPLRKLNEDEIPDEEDEPILEDQWPHLVLVYAVFQKYIESPDFQPSVAKKYITVSFVQQLLQLFCSDDPRERCVLKTLVHRIYGKFLGLRPIIRKQINYIFLEFIYESEQNSGIPELLEILGSIINGFAVPLKQEHIQFLRRTLIPLHKAKSLCSFYAQLVYCVVQFIEKEPTLTEEVVVSLLRLWPHQCAQKQVMLLGEFEEICDCMDPKQFENIFQPLIGRIAVCMASSHFQVSERALCFWNNEYVISLIENYASHILPMILPHLVHVSEFHWNKTITLLAIDTIKMLNEIDPVTVTTVLEQLGKVKILTEPTEM